LKLWKNDTDTYVARDAEHATKLHEELVGGGAPYDPEEFGEWMEDTRPHDALLTIMLDDGPVPSNETKTIGEWIASTLAATRRRDALLDGVVRDMSITVKPLVLLAFLTGLTGCFGVTDLPPGYDLPPIAPPIYPGVSTWRGPCPRRYPVHYASYVEAMRHVREGRLVRRHAWERPPIGGTCLYEPGGEHPLLAEQEGIVRICRSRPLSAYKPIDPASPCTWSLWTPTDEDVAADDWEGA
jgi:hypothetical protein